MKTDNYMNPYLAGIFLGLVLLASFLILGAGLGASGGLARIAAAVEGGFGPIAHPVERVLRRPGAANSLNYYLMFMFVGIFLGGLASPGCCKTGPPHG